MTKFENKKEIETMDDKKDPKLFLSFVTKSQAILLVVLGVVIGIYAVYEEPEIFYDVTAKIGIRCLIIFAAAWLSYIVFFWWGYFLWVHSKR